MWHSDICKDFEFYSELWYLWKKYSSKFKIRSNQIWYIKTLLLLLFVKLFFFFFWKMQWRACLYSSTYEDRNHIHKTLKQTGKSFPFMSVSKKVVCFSWEQMRELFLLLDWMDRLVLCFTLLPLKREEKWVLTGLAGWSAFYLAQIGNKQ